MFQLEKRKVQMDSPQEPRDICKTDPHFTPRDHGHVCFAMASFYRFTFTDEQPGPLFRTLCLTFLFLYSFYLFFPKATRMWGDFFSSSLPREHYRCLIFILSLGKLRPSDQEYKQRETAPTHKEWVYFILFCCVRPGWQKASLNMYWASNRK